MSQAGLASLGGGGGGGSLDTLTGNTGGAISPIGGNIDILGTGVSGSGVSSAGNIYVVGTPGVLTINETQAQFLTNYTAKSFVNTPYSATATDYYISLDTSGGPITIKLPNAPTNGRIFVVKDRTGNSGANFVTVTTVGGVVLLDGSTTYLLDVNYEAATIIFNGTSYEVY